MNDDAPPPVVHSIRCTCAACISARQAEVRRRLEEQRREGRRHELALLEDAAGRGSVFKPLKRAQPGTQPALRKVGR